MKRLITLLFITISTNTMAQEKTFIYEITLFEQFRHQEMWTEREHHIQQEHIAYLDSLTKAGKLQLAGIIDQGLTDHKGFIVLTTDSFDEAYQIAENDPSIKRGMMHATIRPMNIYFKGE